MRQKHILWIYALRSFKEISQRLGSFETVRRAFKIVRRAFKIVRRAFKNSSLEHLGLFEEHLKILFEDRMSDSSCCRQIRWRIGCRYWVQIYLSENRYILADKDRRSISITHTPKQYNNWSIYKYFCSERERSVFLFKIKKEIDNNWRLNWR